MLYKLPECERVCSGICKHMKAIKQQVRELSIERQQNEEAYITLSFSSYNAKEDFCDLLGISTDDKFVKGEDVLKLIK